METRDLDLEAASATSHGPRREGWLRRAGDGLVVWLHRQAQRRDLVPAEFGDRDPVDEADATSLMREWTRQARLWADYNPEQMLAMKAGTAALGVALLALVVLIGAIR
ncbi:hypothetical protein [Phenylobacterium sp.]|uniref:hypothetical protein n=1 Tax=Phenylobacterium sp. TaxID=1871053 RepID=UPI002DF32DB2|nr:hypothetical protein [Phenylobacterium sp.]